MKANHSKFPIDYAREQYHCGDHECVCHQQQPDMVKKGACATLLMQWARTNRSLQDLARRAYRCSIPAGEDYRKAVDGLPVSTHIRSYLLHETELAPVRSKKLPVMTRPRPHEHV
jgi:hypothetical protein